MKRSQVSNLIIILCGVLVVIVLMLNPPTTAAISRYGVQAGLYVVLVTIMLTFGVLLTQGEFSVVHVAGITGFLSLPTAAQPLLLWAIAIGGLIGGTLLTFRQREVGLRRRTTIRNFGTVIMVCARLTLSLYAAGTLYNLMSGAHPLRPPLQPQFMALLVFSIVFTDLYGLLFLLESYVEQRSIRRMLRQNSLLLASMLIIPLPFAILLAVVIVLTPTSLYIYMVGAALLTIGLYRFSGTRFQLQKQLEEQRSLSAVSQALQSDLKLDSLLFAIYNQVTQLMHTDQFVTALYERNTRKLLFPLVMEDGKAVADYTEDTTDSPLGRVLRQQIAQFIDIKQGENYSSLGVPLMAGGRLLGAISVRSNDPRRPLSEDDKRLLMIVAGSASVAIDNAQLYAQQMTRATRVGALNRTLPLLTGTLSLDTVQQTIVAAAEDILQANGVALYMQGDDAMSAMQMVASIGLSQTTEDMTPDDIVKREKKATYLGLDLVANNERLGGLAFFFNAENAYDDEDRTIALTFASQAAQAIQNARQYTVTDMALEQQMRQAIETRDRLQVILDTMTEGILMIDAQGVVTMANPRMDLVGLNARSLLGQPVDTLLENPDLDFAERMGFDSDQKVRNLVKQLRADSRSIIEPYSYSVTNESDERHIERHTIIVKGRDNETLGMMLVFSDETEARELSQMRTDLSNMIVHDLRSPLTAVTTGLRLLREIVPQESPLYPTVASTTETSQRAIRKMMVRVDSLLDISRLDSGAFSLETEPTDVATVADSVCVELSPVAQELDVTLTTDISEETPALDADADKIERVLQNLVDNALKFCPSGGQVTIRAHQPERDANNERFVRIDVSDSGPGIPDEYKTKLFDRFAQIKGRRGKRRGSGLGLTFCRMVVEAHGGRIWIEDNPGGGSIFAFTLPVAEADEVNKVS